MVTLISKKDNMNIYENKIKFLSILFFTSLTKGISGIGILVFTYVLVNFFSLEINGFITVTISFLSGLAIINKFGYSNALIKYISYYNEYEYFKEVNKILKQSLLFIFILSFIIIVTVFLFKVQIARLIYGDELKANYLMFVIICLPVYTFLFLASSFFKGIKKPSISPFTEIGFILIITTFIILVFKYLLSFNLNESRIIIFFILSVFIVFFLTSITMFFYLLNFKQSKYLEDNSKKLPNVNETLNNFFIIDLCNYFRTWGIFLIISFFISQEVIGKFSVAFWIANLLIFIPIIIVSVFSPYLSIFGNSKKFIELRDIFLKSRKFILILNIPILCILFFFSEHILSNLFNIYDQNIYLCLKILSVSVFLKYFLGPVGNIFNMIGLERYNKNITIFISILEVILIFISIDYFGVVGISLVILFIEIIRLTIFLIIFQYLKKDFFDSHNIIKIF